MTSGVCPTYGCLMQETAVPAHMVVAFKQPAANVGPCTTANQVGVVEYNSADLDKTKVSDLPVGFDFSKEKTCT